MSAVEKIKAAAAELSPDEQVELFRWWVQSGAFKRRQLAALKRDLAVGIEQLDKGRYRTYDDSHVIQLAEDVGRSGRERLKNSRKKSGA
ncbi:MAG: hypothetical protein DME22_10855 [Verrucomicrobia bacterium]|nr:MAG: hypothetical protein DME22_10855 [Verrucomicrobiota bacterium]PYJ98740.1 MAG: hypothetical protein DME23_11200 [Verrucomicrobiota bacterium]